MPLASTAELKAALAPIAAISSIIAETRQQLELKLALNFSIFDQVKHDENDISKIIAHLLDPRGSHSHGSSFLKAYLQMLLKHFMPSDNMENNKITKNIENILNSPNLDKASVRREALTKDGRRIDITVTLDALKEFGIENKLTAGDQEGQVSDYLEYLPEEGFLVYLSIENPERKLSDGRLSITPDDAAREIGNGRLFLTKYDPHMSCWIDECLKIAKSDKIRWYLAEIKQLVTTKFSEGGNSQMDINKHMVALLLDDERSFHAALTAANNIDQVKEQLAQNYLKHIHAELEKGVQQYENWKIDDLDDGKTNPPHWCPIKITNQDCDMNVLLSFDKSPKSYKRCIYGISDNVAKKTDGKGKRSLYFDKIKEKAIKILPHGWASDVWPGAEYFISGQHSGKDVDWMDTDFALKLHKFNIDKESSDLSRDAKIMVDHMIRLLEMLNSFFKEEGIIK